MRLLTFAIAAAVTLPLAAATRYTVVAEDGVRTQSRPVATVLVDGAHQRIDVHRETTPFAYDVLLSDDGGATFTALNTPLKTWFRIGPEGLAGRPLQNLTFPQARRKSVRDIKVTPSEEPSELIDGYATHKYVVRASYETREDLGAPVEEQSGATILIWTTDAIDASLAVRLFDFATGVPEVDALLVPALAKIPGVPMKSTVSVTHKFVGGPLRITTVTITVSDIRTVDAPPHAFERPKDYINQAPIIGALGR
jgi:hypothetical protein